MQEATDAFKVNPDHNMTTEEAKNFISAVMDYKAFVDNLNGTLNGIILLLQSVMKQQGLELPIKTQ